MILACWTVNDPCVGSGRLLLHASNISLRLYGQDIDPLAVAMCKINEKWLCTLSTVLSVACVDLGK